MVTMVTQDVNHGNEMVTMVTQDGNHGNHGNTNLANFHQFIVDHSWVFLDVQN